MESQLLFVEGPRPTDCIYLILMLRLDEKLEQSAMQIAQDIRERRGHGDCTIVGCRTCTYRVEPRVVAWEPTQELADQHCMKYLPWDHLYNYALVEEIPRGTHAIGAKVVSFYKMTGDYNAPVNEKIDIPEYYSNGLTCNFSMG